jgi:hypothetical protein
MPPPPPAGLKLKDIRMIKGKHCLRDVEKQYAGYSPRSVRSQLDNKTGGKSMDAKRMERINQTQWVAQAVSTHCHNIHRVTSYSLNAKSRTFQINKNREN